ncbi:MAG: TetR/AcrR family transcriptional regulator [Bacteroidales bacterium]
MARRIDETKIERIREAALEIISESGILNCSVAMIAQQANVSVGYLYRHYPSKDELIAFLLKNSLQIINDKIASLLMEKVSLEDLVYGVTNLVCTTAEEHPAKIKFFIVVFNDFSYEVNSELADQVRLLSQKVIEIYGASGVLKDNLTAADVFTSLIGVPFQYYSIYFKRLFPHNQSTEEIIDHLSNMVLGMIRK